MMSTTDVDKPKALCFCFLEYVEDNSKLYARYFVGEGTRPMREFPGLHIDRKVLSECISTYWTYVDDFIKDGGLSDGADDTRMGFLDELESRGNEIAATFLTPDMQREIWKAAAECDIFVISSNLGEIPFEALFSAEYGERGTFLSDNCVIQRHLTIDREMSATASPPGPASTLVCLDPELLGEIEDFESHLNDQFSTRDLSFVKTSTRNALKSMVQNAVVIHWICEHTDNGLRLQKGIFYSHRDIAVCRFPENSVLFMLSCASGRPTLTEGTCALSAGIAAVSGCTVVAPSSVVAAEAAVKFVLDLDKILSDCMHIELSTAWKKLRNPLGGRVSNTGISAEECYLLWFGIYGDCNVVITREKS